MVEGSYTCGTSDVPLLGITIGEMVNTEAVVSVHQDIRWTYREFNERVNGVAKGLMALGVEKGDRVGIWAMNHAEWILVQFATARIGAIMVNINPAYRTYELEYVLRQAEVSTLIVQGRFKTSDYVGMFGAEITDDDLVARGETLSFDDAINIQYTSGTTGFPKGVVLTHHSVLNNGFIIGEGMSFSKKDRLCIPVPFYHCFGMVLSNLAAVTHGSTMVLPAPAFDAEEVLKTVEKERCTALHGVPTMFIAELTHPNFPKYNYSTLRTGIMAGSPCPIEVMKQVNEKMNMREIVIVYGQTETSPGVTMTTTRDPVERRVSTIGRAFPHTELKIIDPKTGKIVPTGEIGEICARGYCVMKCYYNNPAATHATLDVNRWNHTGDLGTVDAEGYFRIVGRLKDMVIRGGENIYPREIEEFLHHHEKVADVYVVGVPDIKYGEELCAWVKTKPGQALTEEEVKEFCKGRIAHYKIPRYVLFVDDFPMSVTGKIQKFKMREESIRQLDLHEAARVETA